MKKSLYARQIAGFVFTSIVGVILHFLFNWSGRSVIVAPFSAINESIWEHTKLLFFPMLIFALIESRYIKSPYKNFWCIKLIGIMFGTILIPVLYYSVNGAFGQTPDWVNIAIFFVAVFLGYAAEIWLLNKNIVNCKYPQIVIVLLILVVLIYILMTFVPPHIPLFKDPLTNTYGV